MSATALPWLRLAVLVVCRAYRAILLTFAALAVGSVAVGSSPYVVRSGSMSPNIRIGDVVVAKPLTRDARIAVGRVMVFTNPARTDGELLVHRVIARGDQATFTTQGDNNLFPDSTPVPRSAFKAQGVLRVPFIGLPIVWWNQRELLRLVLWVLLTVAAFLGAVAPHRSSPSPMPPAGPRAAGGADLARTRGRRVGRGRVVGTLRVVVPVAVPVALILSSASASATFTARTVSSGTSWTVGTLRQPYLAAALADHPSWLYLLDESQGPWAADASGNSRTGEYAGIAAYRASGALPNNYGYAASLGSSGRIVAAGSAVASPTTFTLEVWLKTSTVLGGPILGFESSRDVRSATADRQLAMTAGGKLTYGAWAGPSSQQTIISPKSYNDGQWHQVALVAKGLANSQQTSTLYVDGQPVASGTTSKTNAYLGWWRVGEGTANALGASVAAGFNADVDEPAVYPTALTAARVQAHYAAR